MTTRRNQTRTLFITGNDTGVGKTVLTCLLAQHVRLTGHSVAAFKPICSGGRADARAIHSALDGELALDTVNPWHFRLPLAPSLAAQKERRRVSLKAVVRHIQLNGTGCGTILVEGAGGLLSPFGHNFDSRDLLLALQARPLIVIPNRLGAVNQTRLVWEALPASARKHAQIVLMEPARPNLASTTNLALIARYVGVKRIHSLPRLSLARPIVSRAAQQSVRTILDRLLASV